MKYTNLFEKLQCVFDLISKDWYGIIFLIISFFFLVFIFTKIISKKSGLLVISCSYLLLLCITIFPHQKQLGIVGNDIINNFFVNLYFPSVYVYFFIYIVIGAISVYALFSKRMSKIYQWFHGITFFVIQFIFVMILNILSQNEIDIFSKASLFSNKNLVILLELSTNIFIAWLIGVLFIYFTNIISESIVLSRQSTKHIKSRKLRYSPADMTTLSTSLDEEKESDEVSYPLPQLDPVSVISSSSKEIFPSIEENVISEVHEDTISTIHDVVEEDKVDFQEFVADRVDTIIPTPKDTSYEYDLAISHDETDQYTLNDYRLFSKILKEIKEHNSSNQVIIDKDMEYRLITKYSSETYDLFKRMLASYSH